MQDRITTPSTQFLAMYEGPGGPISAVFAAPACPEAVRVVKQRAREWYDDARDDISLSPDASDEAVAEALDYGGWTYVHGTDSDKWTLYSRGVA